MRAKVSRILLTVVGVGVLGAVLGGCPALQPPPPPPPPPPPGGGGGGTLSPAETFPKSIHGARPGKATFYMAADGFYTITGVPISQLGCSKCHAATYADGTPVNRETYTPGCRDCHADPARPGLVADSTCLGCHGRQSAEQRLFGDVHRTLGLRCVSCHPVSEMHGDGKEYKSFLDADEPDVKCGDCHRTGGPGRAPSANAYHTVHNQKLDCAACHVRSVSSCYNCHFETEIVQDKKRFFGQGPRTGFKLLVNYNGKVTTGTFQALSYQGKTFLAVAPFFGHSITKDDIECSDCHLFAGQGNPNLVQLRDTGKITVTRWDPTKTGTARLIGPSGVIPVPENWKTALEFAFLTFNADPSTPINATGDLPFWDFLKTEKDGAHMPYGSPLTPAQINKMLYTIE